LGLRSIASALLVTFVVYSMVLSLYSQPMAYGQERGAQERTVTITEIVTSTTTVILISTVTTNFTTTATLTSTLESVVTHVVTAFQTIERANYPIGYGYGGNRDS
jgi:hypothetical protein